MHTATMTTSATGVDSDSSVPTSPPSSWSSSSSLLLWSSLLLSLFLLLFSSSSLSSFLSFVVVVYVVVGFIGVVVVVVAVVVVVVVVDCRCFRDYFRCRCRCRCRRRCRRRRHLGRVRRRSSWCVDAATRSVRPLTTWTTTTVVDRRSRCRRRRRRTTNCRRGLDTASPRSASTASCSLPFTRHDAIRKYIQRATKSLSRVHTGTQRIARRCNANATRECMRHRAALVRCERHFRKRSEFL